MPLSRRSAENGGGWTPPLKLPGNLLPGSTLRDRELSEACWGGWPCTTAELQEAVDADCGLAVLPERCGLVILDCDIRQDFVIRADGSAGLETTEDGEQDLQKVMAELGLADTVTYTVRTPSGGVHYYFRTIPDFCPAIRSSGHRKNWYVDVKASPNVWAVAPPTPEYVPAPADVAELPYKLAWFLREGVRGLPARDGQRRGQGVRAGRAGILQAISEASASSGQGWNSLLFWAACRYGEEGIADEQALTELLEAANAWNEGERRRAERTVKSGLRTGRREGAGE